MVSPDRPLQGKKKKEGVASNFKNHPKTMTNFESKTPFVKSEENDIHLDLHPLCREQTTWT